MADDRPKCTQPKGPRGGKCGRLLTADGSCRIHGQQPKQPHEGVIPMASSGTSHADAADRLEEAAQMLAAGATQLDVANALGVNRSTVSRWWTGNADFRAAVRAMRAAGRDAAHGVLAHEAAGLAQVVVDAAHGRVPLAQARAADIGLSKLIAFHDADVEDRLAALEALAEDSEAGDDGW